jgi:hypothetical protein
MITISTIIRGLVSYSHLFRLGQFDYIDIMKTLFFVHISVVSVKNNVSFMSKVSVMNKVSVKNKVSVMNTVSVINKLSVMKKVSVINKVSVYH